MGHKARTPTLTTPCILADRPAVSMNGHKAVAELLLLSKADVNAKTDDGWTPLHWAAVTGRKDVAEFLRQHGGK